MSRGKLRYAALSVTLPISIVVGVAVAVRLTGSGGQVYSNAWQPLLIGLFFGIIASKHPMFPFSCKILELPNSYLVVGGISIISPDGPSAS